MSLLGNIWVKLGLKPDDFNKGVDKAEKRAERFGSFLGRVSARAIVGFAAVSAAVTKFLRSSIKNYNESEAANIKLQNALRNTGAAIGVNIDELRDYASELQRVNGYADDATMGAMATLTTFRSVQGKVFRDTIAAAQDMASFLSIDLNAAVQQLGKALESPEMGITMLRRSGVVFTEEMTENIRKLVKEGNTYEAQLTILAEVNKRFGGEAARQADTTAGAWKRVGMAFGDLTEHIGAATNATRGLANSLATALETADGIISSSALTRWEKFKVIVLGIGQAKAAEKMVEMDKAQQELTEHAQEYARESVRGLDTIEQAQARLAQEERWLSKATSDQRKADHRAAIDAIKAQIDTLNEKKAQEEEAARQAAERAKEEAERLKQWREEHTGILNELKDEIAEKEKLLAMASDYTEIRKLNEELKLLRERQELLRGGSRPTDNNIPAMDSSGLANLMKTTGPGVDVSSLRSSTEEINRFSKSLNDSIEISQEFGAAIQRGVLDAFDELLSAIETGDWDTTDLVKALLTPLADAAISAGTLILTTGKALESLKTALIDLFGGGPTGAIIAGGALVAMGLAAKVGLAAIARGGSAGAAVGSNAYTYTGGYGVVPAAAGYGGQIELGGTVTVKGQDIQIALDNYNRNKGR